VGTHLLKQKRAKETKKSPQKTLIPPLSPLKKAPRRKKGQKTGPKKGKYIPKV